jgi:hypothetical protein
MNDEKKLTPWFDGSVRPARRGVYEIKYQMGMTFIGHSRWDGRQWCYRTVEGVEQAALQHKKALGPILKWRGLAAKP